MAHFEALLVPAYEVKLFLKLLDISVYVRNLYFLAPDYDAGRQI